MPGDHYSKRQQQQMRERIAQLAARLIAEEGIQDYAFAKRKAARQMGVAATHNLPGNAEIEQALRVHQALYQKDEHQARLRAMRRQALEAMRLLERFNPFLTGSVLNGTAARHSDINIHLFTDSDKEVELFLLNRQLPYRRGEKRYRFGDEFRAIPVFTLHGEAAEINLAVFSVEDLRQPPRSPVDGKQTERARTAQVEALLEIDESRYTHDP